ncbi:MAG: hypothetical protein COA79_07305 [Planctomycetota bacterium]|nr:MAG: hypothetical protein COA79_07305 [Planctomycetota bacterium]
MAKGHYLIPVLLIALIFSFSPTFAADRYVRAGGGNFNDVNTWSTTSGGGVSGGVPTAADDVYLDALSGQLTINVASVCRSIDARYYTGTITHTSAVALSIGDGTAGAGNVALRFSESMIYTLGNVITSEINFISTANPAVQTVDFAGKPSGNITYNGALGSWKMTGDHTTGPTATVTLTNGTLDANGEAFSWGHFSSNNANTRTLSLNAARVAITGTGNIWDVIASLTLSAAPASRLSITNTATSSKTFAGAGETTYGRVLFSGDNITITGSNTFYEIGVHNAGLPNGLILTAGTTQTVTSFTTNGYASNLSIIKSDTPATPATITKTSGIVSVNYMSIKDITAATGGTATWFAGTNSFDGTGNGGGVPWSFTNPGGRYWVGGGASTNWDATVPTNWSATSGGANNASVPASTDNVFFDSNSGTGNSVISVANNIRSLNTTGYTGTITHNEAIVLSIGDATPGANNVALEFGSGFSYILLHYETSQIDFISTSTIVQSVNFAGKTSGAVYYNGAGGSWLMTGPHVAVNAKVRHYTGTLNTNSQNCFWGNFTNFTAVNATMTLGSSLITIRNTLPTSGGQANTFAAGNTSGSFIISPNSATIKIIEAGYMRSIRISCRDWNGMSCEFQVDGSNTNFPHFYLHDNSASECKLRNFTVTTAENAVAGVDDAILIGGRHSGSWLTLTGELNLSGYSSARRLRVSSYNTTIREIKMAGVNVTCSNVDFANLTFSSTTASEIPKVLSGITGGAGDLGNNTGITFTTGIPLYWYSNTAGTKLWSDTSNWYLATAGAGGLANRTPLPQDDAIFDSDSFSNAAGAIIIDSDISRIGGDINCSAVAVIANTPTWNFSADVVNFGSVTLASTAKLILTADDGVKFYMAGFSSGTPFSLTSNTAEFPNAEILLNESLYFDYSAANVFNIVDAFKGNSSNSTVLNTQGVVDFNNQDVTTGNFNAKSGTITMGSGTIDLKGSGAAWTCPAGVTVTANTKAITLSDTTGTPKVFAGGDKSYGDITISGAGITSYTFSGNNTFNSFTDSKTVAHDLIFTTGSTTTFTNAISIAGSADNFVTLSSSATASVFNWSKAGGTVNCDYLVLSNSTVAGGAVYNAGVNTVDGGSNTGWTGLTNQAFTWTGTVSVNWTDAGNWQGGVVPTNTDVAYFTGAFNNPCTINATSNCNVKGINVSQGYTSAITQASAMIIGSRGFEFGGGGFVGGSQTITNARFFRQFGGTFTSTSGDHEITAPGGVDLFGIFAGTYVHNGGLVTIVGAGNGTITTPAGSPFNNLTLKTSGAIFGTFYVANDFNRFAGSNNNLNSDVYLSGDYLGTGGTAGGTGTIRFTGTGTQSVTNPNLPSVIVNTTGPLLVPADITIGGDWTRTTGTVTWNANKATFNNVTNGDITITSGVFYDLELSKVATNTVNLVDAVSVANDLTISSLANLNGSNIEIMGDYTVSLYNWVGTSTMVFKGTGSSNINASGRQGVSTEIDKTAGTITLASNFNIYYTGHDLTITDGDLSLAGFSLTVADNFIVNDSLTLNGSEAITVNSSTANADSNAKFTINPTTSTIIYIDSTVTAVITKLAKTFNNLELGASKLHEVATGSNNGITVSGILSSNGTTSTRSLLRSLSDSATAWELTLNGTSTLANKVTVKNSDASSGTAVLATGSLSLGTNTNWVGLEGLPVITSILSTSNSGAYSKGETVNIQITFSESVTLAGGNLLIGLNCGATVSIGAFTGTTATVAYVIGSDENASILNATSVVLSAGTIQSSSAIDADLSLPSTNISSNKSITIDSIAPVYTTVTLESSNAYVDITFDVAVYNTNGGSGALDAADFTLSFARNGGNATGVVISSVVNPTGAALVGGEKIYRLNLSITGAVSGTESMIIVPTSASIFDVAGNVANTSITSGIISLFDQISPTVTNVTSTNADGNYKKNDVIVIQVVFSEVVSILGTPQLTLETGSTDHVVNLSSGDNSNTLLFNYTVKENEATFDLDYISTTALSLNGGSIKDAGGNSATLTLSAPGVAGSLGANKNILIDTSPVLLNGALAANNVYVDITFSEGVFSTAGTGALLITDLSLTFTANSGTATNVEMTSLLSTSDTALVGGEITVRLMLAVTGIVSGAETINIQPVANSIFDDVGNVMNSSETTGNLNLLVDGSIPTVLNITSSATNSTYDISDTIPVSVKFTEIITVSGTPTLTLETGATDAIASYVSGSGSDTLIFDYIVSDGDVSSDLEVVGTSSLNVNTGSIKSASSIAANLSLPASGVAGSLSANKDIAVDTSVPSITAITTTKANGTYNKDETISIKVTFSRSVTLSGGDFKMALNSGAILSVSVISGDSVDLIYTIGEDDSSSDLDINEIMITSGATLIDSKGRALTLTLPSSTFASLYAIVVDTTSKSGGGGGGGCSYSATVSDESCAEWLFMILIILVSPIFLKSRK